MNGMNTQGGVPDPASPFGRHSGSPPNVGPTHMQQQQQQGQPMQHMSPSAQSAALPYGASNGMGLPMQPMQPQRAAAAMAPSMGAGAGMAGLPGGMNPQQRQLFLMQQQMHQRGNDGVLHPQQQAYATAQQQEKLRQEQQSRMSNHPQHHSPPNNAGSPPGPGAAFGGGGGGAPGMPGIARSVRSPTDGAPATPRMPQKRPAQNDIYQMALYNQAQVQRNASMGARPGTSMGAMAPPPQQQQQQQQQQQGQQGQQAGQYGGNGAGFGPGMMYGGTPGMGAHTGQQNWQLSQQQQQQQQVHSVSPAVLQHHPDAGTPRPTSSASSNVLMPNDAIGESFDSLFNWNGT
ncbi:hypothetical protein JB92DRAFT_567741 [Gautieria morchelliformis]|nr:hypothetical protein JB92DRAFT_567741 [Gautieria morchelliformis]